MTRKIYLGCICLATVLLFSTCDKLTRVNFEHKVNVYFDINPVDPGTYTYAEVLVTNDLETALEDYNASLDKLESMKINRFEMNIEFPPGVTFDPFDDLDAYIGSQSIGEGLIATIDPVPDGGQTTIAFDAESLELVDFFKQPTFTLKIKGSNSGQTNGVTSFKATMWIEVEAQAL